jgi:hypothetical protein
VTSTFFLINLCIVLSTIHESYVCDFVSLSMPVSSILGDFRNTE